MSKKPLPWFRLYADTVDDEKLRLLAFEDRWHFMAMLCCKGQGIIDAAGPLLKRKVAVKLGLQLDAFDELVRRLADVGLIERDTLQPIGWDERQFVSDTDPTAAERKRRQREKERVTDESRVTPDRDVTNVTRTDTDTDTDTEKNKESGSHALPVDNSKPKASALGARLPADWVLTKALGVWAATEQPTWTPEHIRKVAAAFKDHWIAQPGQKGRKTDWDATWRNWVRKEGPLAGNGARAVGAIAGGWWESDAGITAMGEELQVPRQKDEPTPQYIVRVAKAAGRGPWIDHILKAAQRVSPEWQHKVVSHLGEALMPTDWYAS